MTTPYKQTLIAIGGQTLFDGGREQLSPREIASIRRALLIADAVESGTLIKPIPSQERDNRFYWEAIGHNICIEHLRKIGVDE